VEAALDTHSATAARALTEKLRTVEGVEVSEVETQLFLKRLRARLGKVREKMVLADEANVAELGDDFAPRQKRDSWAQQVFRSVSDLRATIEKLYGAGTSAEVLGIVGRTAQDPVVLHRQGRRLAQRCGDPQTPWPSLRYGGFQFSPAIAAEELRPKVEALGDALREVATQRRRAEATLGAKLTALDEFDQTYQGVASIAKGVFILADLKDLAGRLRPPRRGISQASEEEPQGVEEPLQPFPDPSFPVSDLLAPVRLPPLPTPAP